MLELGVIPGSIFGNPLESPLWYEVIGSNKKLNISMVDYLEKIIPFASTLTREASESGLIVDPKNTKFARVSTFGIDNNQYVSGAFYTQSGDYLMLMYSNQGCSITGTLSLNGKPVVHEITIDTKGFHWVHVSQNAKRDTITSINRTENINLKFNQ